MPNPDPTLPPGADPDVAAAELALGLLEGDERAAALRRQLAEPAFAREVERWREHFGTLFASTVARVPPAHLAERNRIALGQLGIGQAIEEGGVDRTALLVVELVEAQMKA